MINSINTNSSAYGALRASNTATSSLNKNQNRLTTGKDVSSPKDNAALLAIANKMLGDMSGLNASKQSIDRATSTTDVAMAASESISGLLLTMKEKAVSAKDEGLDDASRQALNDEFEGLRDQITSIMDSASFNGTNALKAGGGSISAITDAKSDKTITQAEQDLTLGGANITFSATATISSQSDALSVVDQIEASLANMNSIMSNLGATSNRLENAQEFNSKLSDTIEEGIGNLVDADMASVAASLASDQVKQSLSLTSLNIANNAPKAITQLF